MNSQAYENSIRAREAAASGLSSVEHLADNITQRKQLLLRVLSHRVEAEKFNATSAEVSSLHISAVCVYEIVYVGVFASGCVGGWVCTYIYVHACACMCICTCDYVGVFFCLLF